MYDLINQSAQVLVSTIPSAHVTEYEWLVRNIGQVATSGYQRKYRQYWAMNAARLSPAFYTAYFGALSAATNQTPTLNSIAQILHTASARQGGQKSLQFSFATKLVHMTNPHLPIYDAQVTAFYFFQEPSTILQQRINGLVAFHGFLTHEYARVISGNLLAVAIQEFRVRLNPQNFTDEKIVDSLIWAFVALLRKGALPKRQVVFH